MIGLSLNGTGMRQTSYLLRGSLNPDMVNQNIAKFSFFNNMSLYNFTLFLRISVKLSTVNEVRGGANSLRDFFFKCVGSNADKFCTSNVIGSAHCFSSIL